MKVTIVICTYNGAKDLPGVLDHLHDQEGTDRIRWEVLVVENNSTDSTDFVVRQYQEHQEREAPLRYAFEGR
jgi:glycosyltransferase involved in cell wall biosynthesis